MQTSQMEKFGKIRNFLWPIHRHEHRKLVPMFMLFLLITFVYNLLRAMKLTLVVTAGTKVISPEMASAAGEALANLGSGAEVVPFLKVWGVLPSAVLFTYLFTLLAGRFTRAQVFYIIVGFFLGFFVLFTLFLYPNRESLELIWLPNFLHKILPLGCKGLISAIRHWPSSLFYIFSEMWSSVVLAVLFWGYANEITTVEEAKRFYAIFTLGANCSGIFSGQIARLLNFKTFNPNLPFGQNAWDQSVALQIGLLFIIGLSILFLFRWVDKDHHKRVPLSEPAGFTPKKKPNVSLIESFAYLAKSRYMLYITIIVVSYNIVFNLADVVWTDQIHFSMQGNADQINAYMNNITSITGIFATISALILSGNVIRHFGWTATAMITPIIWLTMGLGVFACLLCQGHESLCGVFLEFFRLPMQTLVILFASAQICLGRAGKYTVFDESKEIAFIPLPQDKKRKGKAVVDGIASRFGKAGGSMLIQVLLITFGSLSNAIPYIAIVFFAVIGVWIYAVRGLGVMVKKSVDDNQMPDAELEPEVIYSTQAEVQKPLPQRA